MQRDDVKAILRAWGHATVNRFALTRADHSRHVLSNLRDLPAKVRPSDERELVKRDGRSRRLYMAARIDCKGLGIVPLWAVDPVPARNDADRPHDNPEVAVDQGIPDDLRWVDAAVNALDRKDPLRALVLRTEFTNNVSQAVKARMVSDAQKRKGHTSEFTLAMYRRELEKAIDVLEWEASRAA